MTTTPSGSDSGVKKAVGRVIQGWTRFSGLLRQLKYLALAQKGAERKKGKAKGRESMSRVVKGEIAVLGEGKAVPSDI